MKSVRHSANRQSIPRLSHKLWASIEGRPAGLEIDRGLTLQIMADLVEEYPKVTLYRRSYGGTLSNLANVLNIRGRDPDRAEQFAREAIRQQMEAQSSDPEHPTTNQYLANHHAVLAGVLLQRGDYVEALKACEMGLEIAANLQQRYPDNEFVSFVIRDLQRMKLVTEQEFVPATSEDNHQVRNVSTVLRHLPIEFSVA